MNAVQTLPMPERKLSAAEAGKLNGVSAKTLIRWAASGMRHYRMEKKYLFYQSDIDAWMNTMFMQNAQVHTITPQSAAGAKR